MNKSQILKTKGGKKIGRIMEFACLSICFDVKRTCSILKMCDLLIFRPKVILLGDENTGKTKFLSRLAIAGM